MEDALVARWRRENQLAPRADAASAAAVVERLCAAQAQDLLPATWALAQRAGALTDRAVRAELDAGALLRTHVLRPTWHFVAPGDIRWLLRATAPRVHRTNSPLYRRSGLDDETRARTRRTIAATLADGEHRTRAQLGGALGRAGLDLAGLGLVLTLMDAELEGVVCSGVAHDGRQTYALLDERAPGADDRTRDEAVAELALRFFVSRGPATERDLATWASLTLTETRRATAAVAGRLESFQDDGVTWWHAPGATPPAPRGPRVDLVQAYDELVMSYSRTRDVLTGGTPLADPAPRPLSHWVLVDGRAIGRWAYERDGSGRPARLLTRALRPWSAVERGGVAAAVAAFGRFADADLTWTEVTA